MLSVVMKFSAIFVALAGLVNQAQAQSSSRAASSRSSPSVNGQCVVTAANIPPCGLNVLTSTASKSFGCGVVDLDCQCSYSATIQQLIFSEVLSACGPTTALMVQSGAQEVCSCVSYNGTPPPEEQITRTTAQLNPNGNALCVDYGLAIPTCGTAVLQSIGNSIAGCGDFDFQCQCGRISEIQNIASTPVIDACGTTTALYVQSAAAQLCSCITANNMGLPAPTGTVATIPTSVSSRADAAPRDTFKPLTGLAGLLSVFSGIVAML